MELIDFWSIPHFLFGAVTALFASVFGIPMGIAFVLTIVLAVCWEWFESSNKVVESIRNRVTDVIYPLIAFPATFLYAQNVAVEQERRVALLAIVSILFFYINYMAWKARFENDRDFMN
jgi:CDP-diglyceride synthetase